MRKTLWMLFITILVINNIKNGACVCDNVNNKVVCTSVGGISIGNLSSITEIEVRNNSELNLSASVFKSAINLKIVRIQYTKINKIFSDTFKDLPLTRLYLRYNDILSIFPGAFFNLTKIMKIDLTGNKLQSIRRGVFNNLPVQDLILSKNSISSIEDRALENLPNLEKLRLNDNELETIFVTKILSDPEQLQILWLHKNSLSMVTNYMLQNLANLTLLNLGFNLISVIEPQSFEQTPKLETLVLTHNNLKEIDGSVFPPKGSNSLEKLYLDNNKLMFLSSNFLFRLNNLRKITLVGNPWLCSCLNEVNRLLAQNEILEKCAEDYNNGRRPVCVSEKGEENVCRYTYNEELSETYETYKKNNPLYKLGIFCIL